MLLLPRAVRILLAREPVDMRNSIDGLAALVRTQWKEDLYAGHLFVFVSRRGDRVKILSWDAGGFVLTYKRLEQGRFRLPPSQQDALGVQLDATQLSMLLDGIDVTHVRRPSKWAPPPGTDAIAVSGSLVFPNKWQSSMRRTAVHGERRPSASRERSLRCAASTSNSKPASPSCSVPFSERKARSSRVSRTSCVKAKGAGGPRVKRR